MSDQKPIVTVKEVSFDYREGTPQSEWALKHVNVNIYEGETVAIVGPNGSGKSTLAKLLNGLLQPQTGEIAVDGLNPALETDVWAVRERVGMVFQNPDNQIVAPTVQDDVAFGLENLGLPRQVIKDRVQDAISRVGLEGLEDTAPNHLSGGQKQRLAIAGILAMRPRLIILDEATSMLDPHGRKEVADVIRYVKREGIAVLMVTHAPSELWEADRVVVMAEGTVRFTGSPEDVFRHGEELLSLGLDVPFAVSMQHALRERGLPLTDAIKDERSLVNALWTLWQKT